jgi:hypothetical protein
VNFFFSSVSDRKDLKDLGYEDEDRCLGFEASLRSDEPCDGWLTQDTQERFIFQEDLGAIILGGFICETECAELDILRRKETDEKTRAIMRVK